MQSENVKAALAALRADGFMCDPATCAHCKPGHFQTWEAVLAHAREGKPLWYHAPMDLRPRLVVVRQVFKNGKIRLMTPDLHFTADEGHLSRFRSLPQA